MALTVYFLYMASAFFYCHNINMDIMKLCEKVLQNEEVKDIPVVYVFAVILCVFEAIESGECFYNTEFE